MSSLPGQYSDHYTVNHTAALLGVGEDDVYREVGKIQDDARLWDDGLRALTEAGYQHVADRLDPH